MVPISAKQNMHKICQICIKMSTKMCNEAVNHEKSGNRTEDIPNISCFLECVVLGDGFLGGLNKKIVVRRRLS